VITIALNMVALWKQEARRPLRGAVAPAPDSTFRESWIRFCQGDNAVRRLLAVGLGTMAFSMEDVLLEPYGGQILHLAVGTTTKLTATLAIGGLLGFGLASRVLSRGYDPARMASNGAMVGVPAFLCVISAAPLESTWLFALGTALIGFGGGLFGHGTLTATMNHAPDSQRGLALGAWGAVQASAAGLAVALGGVIRDLAAAAAAAHPVLPAIGASATGYTTVYAIEVVLLLVTIVAMSRLTRPRARSGAVRDAVPVTAAHDALVVQE
jgi:BCD family chlorophyll transporter-like MFS transporter